MTEGEQTKAFANAIKAVINRFRSEFDLSYAATIGVLQLAVHLVCAETQELSDDEEEDEEQDYEN